VATTSGTDLPVIYTVKASMLMLPGEARGFDRSEMVHHFEWPDDETALEEFGLLVPAYKDSVFEDRWTCVREDLCHRLTLYSRVPTNPEVWTYLGEAAFALPGLLEFTLPVPLPGDADLELGFKQRALYDHDRGAVLVIQRGVDRSIVKRTYVGPCSPFYCWVDFPFALLPWLVGAKLLIKNFANLDPPPEDTDSVDVWRLRLVELARDHVHELGDYLPIGTPALVSWKRGEVTGLGETRASFIRADIRSRGQRLPLSEPRFPV
jgi:hypothetical protein